MKGQKARYYQMQATVGKFLLIPAAVVITFVFIVLAILNPSIEMFLATLGVVLFAIVFWFLSKFFQQLADSAPEQECWEETK